MKNVIVCFIFALFPYAATGLCSLSTNIFSCKDTNYTDLIKSFYKHSFERIAPSFTFNIKDSTFYKIEYFPNLPRFMGNATTEKLTITNSSLSTVLENAFEELAQLQYLDLSHNKLNNILFVKQLPVSLKILYLNNNNISYVDDVFGTLEYLDLSVNNIQIIDFQNVFLVHSLNLSENRIETLIPPKGKLAIEVLDLSHNKIVYFHEDLLSKAFYHLDIGWNRLKSLKLLQGERKLIKITGNNVSQILVDKLVKVDDLDLSSTNASLNFAKTKIIVRKHLLMGDNKIGILNKSIFNILNNSQILPPYRPTVDLSNSSINDISSYHFQGLQTTNLNLSNNNITLLRSKIFYKSYVKVLDLSNSKIERIQNYAFKNLRSEKIDLKANKLESINNIFNDVEVHTLDLSFNKFKFLTNHSFLNCRGLVSINLEHCLIEKIEPNAFFGLKALQTLLLGCNKLFILETNSFNNLPVEVLILKGNKIDTIRSKAFNNLNNLKQLNLSKVALRNVEPYAFNNLSSVEMVDLRHNNLTIIPHYMFIGMDKLSSVYLELNKITTFNPFSHRLKLDTLTLTFKGMFKANQILNLNMKHLHIIDSKIDMLKADCFAGLYNLVELHFNNSYVYMETGALNNLFSLKFLDSQTLFKHMRGIKKNTFRDLRSLENLDLSRLSIRYLESKAFSGLTKLVTLLLNSNNLTNLKEDTFIGLDSLKTLDLSNCSIDACHDKSFTGLESLEILRLEYNTLVEIKSELLFQNLNNLLELHLGHNKISILHVQSFYGLNNLMKLHLQDNYVKDIPIGIFQYLPTLKALNLSNNMIELLHTGAFSNLERLKVLDLSNNQLVKLDYVDIFFPLKQLEIVRFDGNRLKQFDFRRLVINLKEIKYVGLSRNKWQCDTLSVIIESLNNESIHYKPAKPVFDNDNIDGVGCLDLCKFLYCPPETGDPTLH